MLTRFEIEQQLKNTLTGVDAPECGKKYEGKVRDCFTIGDKLILVASDRLSAFDRVLTTIPFKGQILTETAQYWFEKTTHIVQNHVISHPHPNVIVTRQANMLPVEVVVRGYLTGSAWRDYEAGHDISGITLPSGMKRSQQFDSPIITPSTKAEQGLHDEPISSKEIVRTGLVNKSIWNQACEVALQLFEFGQKQARKQGLILVDTKYEFGLIPDTSGTDQLVLADEIHTQDSSRYWMFDSYNDLFTNEEDPEMLDKEFVRRWLIKQGYMGEGQPPTFPDNVRIDTSLRYMKAFEIITGQTFTTNMGSTKNDIEKILGGCT